MAGRGADFNDFYSSLEYTWSRDDARAAFGTSEAVSPAATKGKAQLLRRAMIVSHALDCIGICKVPSMSLIGAFDLKAEAHLTTALTGRPIGPEELFRAGERVITLERHFNVLRGHGETGDRLPDMFFDEDYDGGAERPPGPYAGMESMKHRFYEHMKWDGLGRPTTERVREMDVEDSPATPSGPCATDSKGLLP